MGVLGCHPRGGRGIWLPRVGPSSGDGKQKHCRRRDALALLPAHQPRCSPPSSPGGSGHLPDRCLRSLTAPGAPPFPGGTFSGSGNSEFYSGCSSECTKGKGFRSRSLKLPHFSLSQMTVSAFGAGGWQGHGGWRGHGGRQEPCLQRGVRAVGV